MGRWRSVAILVGLAACGDGQHGEPGALGILAVSTADSGAVAVVDVATGERLASAVAGAPFGAVSLSDDQTEVAFARDNQLMLDREVFALDIDSQALRQISPSTGSMSPAFRWLRSGWLVYSFVQQSSFRTAIVGPGGLDAREIGELDSVIVDESPVDSRICYIECADRIEGHCVYDLVVEQPDGSGRTILASDVAHTAPRFTLDGSAVVYAAPFGDEFRLLLQALAGGAPRELVSLSLATHHMLRDSVDGGSRFSPNGEELLVARDGTLIAVALDGSGYRTMVDQSVNRAAFSSTGEVVYEVGINTESPPDDTPVYEYSTYVVAGTGEERALREDDPLCRLDILSPSGSYVGYRCESAPVHEIGGPLVLESEGYSILGFDRAEEGVVVATADQVQYQRLDGTSSYLVAHCYHGEETISSPAFDYAP